MDTPAVVLCKRCKRSVHFSKRYNVWVHNDSGSSWCHVTGVARAIPDLETRIAELEAENAQLRLERDQANECLQP